MKKTIALSACIAAFGLFGQVAGLVSRDIGDPEMNRWEPGTWVTAGGDVLAIDDRPADGPKGAKALRFETRYAARAFGGWNASLKNNILPGRPVKLTGWVRLGNDKSHGFEFSFTDANTNDFKLSMMEASAKAGDRNRNLKLSREWQKFVMYFPAEVNAKKGGKAPLRFPVRFSSVSQSNWGDRNNPEAVTRLLDIYDFRLHTDMSGVPESERPYEFSVSYPVVGNTFFFGVDRPQLKISAGSWIGREQTLRFKAKIIAADGAETKLQIPDFKVLDGGSLSVDLPKNCSVPGAYKVILSAVGFPKEITGTSRYVVCLKPRELTYDEKLASGYGINIHGGSYVGYEKFARLGFTWVRDYAYTYGWMVRARGEGGYTGWPWYPKIVKAAEDVGLMTLPCLMGAVQIKRDAKDDNDPSFTPNNEWRRQMALIVNSFPTLMAWELDNETDNNMHRTLDGYGRYCQAFGDIVKATRPDAMSVAPGLAGIYVDQTRKLVERGYFRNIDVVNGHRYCGKDGPEYSKANLNTGMSEAKPAYLRDVWRHWKRAATCDGRFRQLWVTEWGWDTIAGQPVTEWEQAAYLQRKWVLAMGNGVEKMFWYWYYDDDVPNPNYFFVGCGIFDRYRNPKPSAASFAALRTFIPGAYEYIGTANFGPKLNHMAQILKAEGKIVALAYKINKDGPDLVIDDEKAEKITDMFGRELKPGRRKLDIAPTWYVGLDKDSDWLKQCPMDIISDFYVRNVGGEAIKVELTQPGRFEYSVNPPKGWKVEKRDYGFDVTGPAGLERGNTSFTVTGRNGDVSKTMSVEVDVVPQAYAKTYAAGFDGEFKLEVVNQSAYVQNFKVKASLPEGWAVEPAETTTGELKPEEMTTLRFKLVKSTAIDPKSGVASPKFSIVNSTGLQVDYAPIIPRVWAMRSIKPGSITFDGDLSDWDERFRLNSFMVGPSGDKDRSKFYFAHAEDGLYMAMDIDDSKCFVADPGSFWRAADCFELQLTTPGGVKFKDTEPWCAYDHQFWICPMKSEGKVFAGFWANCKDQKSSSPMEDVKSSVVTTPRGYRAEVFIPASRLHGWEKARPGAEMALSFTLAVQGLVKEHELYWPSSKKEQAMKKPWMWARVELVK